MINKIYKGIKRLIFGSTTKFTTEKRSTTLSGGSFTGIYSELLENPEYLMSIEFLTDDSSKKFFRIVANGVKLFPFGDDAEIRKGIMTFSTPIEVAAGSFLQVEIRDEMNSKEIVIMQELAFVELI